MRTVDRLAAQLGRRHAWLAPLPPGNIWKLLPSTVSPGAGSCPHPHDEIHVEAADHYDRRFHINGLRAWQAVEKRVDGEGRGWMPISAD